MVVRFHDEAEEELLEAGAYYADRSLSVVLDFEAVVQQALEQIVRMPRSAPTWPGRPDVRRRVLTKFPFAIVYLLERDGIFVVAVEHAKRRPGYWLVRLPR